MATILGATSIKVIAVVALLTAGGVAAYHFCDAPMAVKVDPAGRVQFIRPSADMGKFARAAREER